MKKPEINKETLATVASFFSIYVLMIIVPNYNYSPFFIRPEAILVALTLIFGLPAIIGVTIASMVDVIMYVGKLEFVILLPVTMLAATSLAYWFVKRSESPYRFLAGTWIITFIITAVMGTYSFFNPPHNEIYQGIAPWLNVFSQSFLSINIVGLSLIYIIRKRYPHASALRT